MGGHFTRISHEQDEVISHEWEVISHKQDEVMSHEREVFSHEFRKNGIR
jgi:type VI protein secretion system component Hcp